MSKEILSVSDFKAEFLSYDLYNLKGEIYHTISAEMCRIGITTRYRGDTEACFIRNNGAWLPALFHSHPV